jgi:uncharacterized protein (TIGR03083 family)
MPFTFGYLEALHEYQDVFLATIVEADPAVPVPWCGDWTVRELVEHLAGVHRWAAGRARMAHATPLGAGPFDLAELYALSVADVRAALSELDPDARAWTLLDDGVPPAEQVGTVRFWHRRQMLETLVHTWDLRVAIGLDFDPGAAAWLDCVDEVVTVMHPRQLRLGRIGPPVSRVRFEPDIGGFLCLTGAPADAPEITISGPARSLALLAWGRIGPEDPTLSIAGDRAVLEALLATGLTP